MRYLLALLIIVGGAVGGFLIHRELIKPPPVVLPPPPQLAVTAGGTPLLPGGWTNSSALTLSAKDPPGVAAGLDVEVRQEGEPFLNSPTSLASAVDSSVQVAGLGAVASPRSSPVHVRLPDGSYHWQVRLHNGQGVSPWVPYRGVINVDTTPPVAPQVSSPTDPNPKTTYHSSTMAFEWRTSDAGSGVAGYSYRLDTDPRGVPRSEIRTADSHAKLVGLDTGTYYFHVRSLDRAGNWGGITTFPVHIDVTPPGLAHVRFSQFQFDPLFDPLRVSFAVTRPAQSVRVGVYRQRDGSLVRLYTLTDLVKGQKTGVAWDGRDGQGRPVAAGLYEIYVRAVDRWGHSSLSGWRDFVIDYRRIVVSLNQQRLWAYNGNQLVLSSLVTTGNRALPTPTGTFHILGKFHPFTFKSPWPKSSPYYYPPSKTKWAMLFQEGGYFIHDAPWRSAFGPGTNAGVGKPGSNYTGTHGCVNVPPDVAQRLFAWADIGTVVQVIR
jgi:hypothetical protein